MFLRGAQGPGIYETVKNHGAGVFTLERDDKKRNFLPFLSVYFSYRLYGHGALGSRRIL